MDIPAASGSSNVASPLLSAVTPRPYLGGGGDVEQTQRLKTPGSGMTVFGRYRLERVLGRGGMGVVWLANDLKLERPVALKFLPSLIGLDPAAVKELKTETRRGLELSHPHIVRIYDFMDDDDAAAISMEFVDGKTLSELRMHTEHGVFSVEEISQWLLGVCDALDYAHFQRKLIHRDLKPANIMLTSKDAVAKIADFGIARSLSDTMSRLSAAHIGTSGTLPYMSPQQAMGERPQPTDDVYSLGATLYELLTGKPPFYRGDLSTQINSKIPPSVRERRQELEVSVKEPIPKLWEEVIAACLHKEASMRPSCAGVMAEMLGLKTSTMQSITTSGTYVTPSARTSLSQPEDSRRAPIIVAALSLVAGAGVAAWFFTQAPKQNSAARRVSTAEIAPAPTKATTSPNKAEKTKTGQSVKALETPLVVPPERSDTGASSLSQVPGALDQPPAPMAPVTGSVTTVPGTVVAPVGAPSLATSPWRPSPQILDAGFGKLSLTPDPDSASAGALASLNIPRASMGELPPLPTGFEIPPEGLILNQPDVPPPPSGYWTLEQVFPVMPQASYSEKGKRYLLYKTQATLKELGLYTSTVDGAEGKGTHNAIILFQVRKGLTANGLLDLPTLAALNLSAEVDKPDWALVSSSPGPYRRRSAPAKEEPNFFQKTGDTLKKLNPFGAGK